MARVVVDVMLKPEILDPQGKAVLGAFGRLGFDQVTGVRQGKRFEIELDEGRQVDAAMLEQIDEAAKSLLANPVIEDYTVTLLDADLASDAPADSGLAGGVLR